MNEIQTHTQALDILHTIHCDIVWLSHITMFMSIGLKEAIVEKQELWLLYDKLQEIAKQTQDIENYLQTQTRESKF